MYDLNQVSECLNTDLIGQTAIQFEEVQSTQQKSRSICDTCPDGTVIFSENQTKCRTRFGREWLCVPGKNIYMSIILKPSDDGFLLSMLEAAAAASVCRSVSLLYEDVDCGIKWPNDIYINEKKISSIMCEPVVRKNKKTCYIISMMINANGNGDDFADEIKKLSTSISAETGSAVPREILIGNILNSFEEFYKEILSSSTIEKSLNIYEDKLVLKDRTVAVKKTGSKAYKKYTAKKIDGAGNLLALDSVGNIVVLNSGETTLKYDQKDKNR
jgi:BirA family biotin operon repressor/biotin-[acetyl-CoA-carboxylase] ligase